MHSDISEVLFSAQAIADRVGAMGAAIAADYATERPLIVGILSGCFPFVADLARAIDTYVEVDFMAVSSYGAGTTSSGVVRTLKDLETSIDGRHVVLVEDISDTGLTLHYIIENLRTRQPRSLDVCALLDKADARKKPIEVKYRGFSCPNAFVVGYGLDYAGLYRNLPYIGVLRREIYAG